MFAFKKDFTNNENQPSNTGKNIDTKHWHEERHDKLLMQRNFLVIFLVLLLLLSVATVVTISIVIKSKEFDPFVIQVDESTGIARVVNPVGSTVVEGNEALAKYFIKRYVIARETFNVVDFSSVARSTVRLFSNSPVYRDYIGYIRKPQNDPSIIYGEKNSTYLTLKSWSKLDEKKYIMRFSITENSGGQKIYNKIAVVEFDYVAMELTPEQREINPIGFQVIAYRVDDDNS